jgi:hypothetical protein
MNKLRKKTGIYAISLLKICRGITPTYPSKQASTLLNKYFISKEERPNEPLFVFLAYEPSI